MGVVYKAKDLSLNRHVALKFLSADVLADETQRIRFTNEAKAAATLDHPNVCTVYEINENEGAIFIAMAYVEGESLDRKIARSPLNLSEAIEIAEQIARGLHAAHGKGVVHRDIKPGNVMLTVDGSPKIVDFGLALLRGESRLTNRGVTVGTTAYMSPEQAFGAKVDHRTDIWAWGVVLYEMISGQLPFLGDYPDAIVYSIINENPAPLTGLRTGVPMELEGIIGKAMEKNSEERYQHFDDLLVDLKKSRSSQRHAAFPHAQQAGLQASPSSTSTSSDPGVGLGWWMFHQFAVIVFCSLLTAALFQVSVWAPGVVTRFLFIAGLAIASVIAIIRIHLLFTSRLNRAAILRELDRVKPWARRADWGFSAALVVAAFAVSGDRRLVAALLMGAAAAYAAVFLLVEPATRAAVFPGDGATGPGTRRLGIHGSDE